MGLELQISIYRTGEGTKVRAGAPRDQEVLGVHHFAILVCRGGCCRASANGNPAEEGLFNPIGGSWDQAYQIQMVQVGRKHDFGFLVHSGFEKSGRQEVKTQKFVQLS